MRKSNFEGADKYRKQSDRSIYYLKTYLPKIH